MKTDRQTDRHAHTSIFNNIDYFKLNSYDLIFMQIMHSIKKTQIVERII